MAPRNALVELSSGELERDPNNPEEVIAPVSPKPPSALFQGYAPESNPSLRGLSLADLYYEQEAQRLQGLKRSIAEEQFAALKDAETGGPLTKEQALYATALAILPALVGLAIKGKKGLAAGVEAGALGERLLFDDIARREKEARENALLEYRSLAGLGRAAENDLNILNRTRLTGELAAQRMGEVQDAIMRRQEARQEWASKESLLNNARILEREIELLEKKAELASGARKEDFELEIEKLKNRHNLTMDELGLKHQYRMEEIGVQEAGRSERLEKSLAFKSEEAEKNRDAAREAREDWQAFKQTLQENAQAFQERLQSNNFDFRRTQAELDRELKKDINDKNILAQWLMVQARNDHQEKMLQNREESAKRLKEFEVQLKRGVLTEEQKRAFSEFFSVSGRKVEPDVFSDREVAKIFVETAKQDLQWLKEERYRAEAYQKTVGATVSGIDWMPGHAPSSENTLKFKQAAQLTMAKNALDSLFAALERSYAKYGYKMLDDKAVVQEALKAWLVLEFKNMQLMGANFTFYEQKLSSEALASFKGFLGFLEKSVRGIGNRDLVALTRKSQEMNTRVYLQKLSSLGAYVPGVRYNKEWMKARGIPFDEDGRALRLDTQQSFAEKHYGRLRDE